ncbi:hypothetical protein ABPG72_006662 [Tetrahymena utriculariae]
MDYLETEKDRLETYQSQNDKANLRKQDQLDRKYKLKLKCDSQENSFNEMNIVQSPNQAQSDNNMSEQNKSNCIKKIQDSVIFQDKKESENGNNSIKIQGNNENKLDVYHSSYFDPQKEIFISSNQRKYNHPNQSGNNQQVPFKCKLTRKSEIFQSQVLNPQDISTKDTEQIVKSQKNFAKKKQGPNQFSLYFKTLKAVRQFKLFLIPKSINIRSSKILNDASHYLETNKVQTVFNPFEIMEKISKSNYNLKNFFRELKSVFSDIKVKTCKFLDEHITVLEPNGYFKMIFDIIMIFAIIVCIFFNTVEIFFAIDFYDLHPYSYPILDHILLILFILDIVFNLNTGVFNEGQISKDRVEIFNNYYDGRFLHDALTLLSFIRKRNNQIVTSFFDFFVFFKIGQVSLKLQQYQQTAGSNIKYARLYYSIQLLRLVLFVIFVAHCVAVIFYGQIIFAEWINFDDTHNWVEGSTVVTRSDSWLKLYIFSLYFSVTTMTTVGFGDITPKNGHEAVIVIISMIIACGVFAYTFNLIGSIVSEMNRRQEEFKIRMKKVYTYLSNRNVDQDLKYQVLKFLEFKYNNENTLSQEEEEGILDGLSDNLIYQINYQSKYKILNSGFELFKSFSKEIKDEVCMKLKIIRGNKEEIIFEQDTMQDDPQMYFIHEGSIEIFFKNKQTKNSKESILNVLKEGQFFGEISFFTDKPRSAGARVKSSCILFSLSKSDFLSVLQNDIFELEKYHLLNSKLQFSESNQQISQQCYYCNKETHMIKQCPHLHYNPDHHLIILKNNFSVTSVERKNLIRNRQKSRAFEIMLEVTDLVSYMKKKKKSECQLNSDQGSSDEYLTIEDQDSSSPDQLMYSNHHREIIQKLRKMYNNQELTVSDKNSNSNSQSETEQKPSKRDSQDKLSKIYSNKKIDNEAKNSSKEQKSENQIKDELLSPPIDMNKHFLNVQNQISKQQRHSLQISQNQNSQPNKLKKYQTSNLTQIYHNIFPKINVQDDSDQLEDALYHSSQLNNSRQDQINQIQIENQSQNSNQVQQQRRIHKAQQSYSPSLRIDKVEQNQNQNKACRDSFFQNFKENENKSIFDCKDPANLIQLQPNNLRQQILNTGIESSFEMNQQQKHYEVGSQQTSNYDKQLLNNQEYQQQMNYLQKQQIQNIQESNFVPTQEQNQIINIEEIKQDQQVNNLEKPQPHNLSQEQQLYKEDNQQFSVLQQQLREDRQQYDLLPSYQNKEKNLYQQSNMEEQNIDYQKQNQQNNSEYQQSQKGKLQIQKQTQKEIFQDSEIEELIDENDVDIELKQPDSMEEFQSKNVLNVQERSKNAQTSKNQIKNNAYMLKNDQKPFLKRSIQNNIENHRKSKILSLQQSLEVYVQQSLLGNHKRNFSSQNQSLHQRELSQNKSSLIQLTNTKKRALRFSNVETFISVPDEVPFSTPIDKVKNPFNQRQAQIHYLGQPSPSTVCNMPSSFSSSQPLKQNIEANFQKKEYIMEDKSQEQSKYQALTKLKSKETNKIQHEPLEEVPIQQELYQQAKKIARKDKRTKTHNQQNGIKKKLQSRDQQNEHSDDNRNKAESQKRDKFKKRTALIPLQSGRLNPLKALGLFRDQKNKGHNIPQSPYSIATSQSPIRLNPFKPELISIKDKSQQERENLQGSQMRLSAFKFNQTTDQNSTQSYQQQQKEGEDQINRDSIKKQIQMQKQQTVQSQPDQMDEVKIEQQYDTLIFDKMKEYKNYFPSFNVKTILTTYNKLKNIQNNKFPSYFNVYSFYNRFDYKKIYKQKPINNSVLKRSVANNRL